MTIRPLLERTAGHAAHFIDSLDSRRIAPIARLSDLRAALARPLASEGAPAEQVVDDLVRDVDGGILASGSGRFFGWVIGGALPAALAADWLTTAWDQNTGMRYATPATAAAEEAAGSWLLDLLALPEQAAVGFVTGATMANFSCLAAA